MKCGGVPDELRGLEVISEEVDKNVGKMDVLEGFAAAESTSLGLPDLLSPCSQRRVCSKSKLVVKSQQQVNRPSSRFCSADLLAAT